MADAIRTWGDFRDTITVTVLLLAAGWLLRRRDWRRLAVAFFLAVSLSGISVNALRFSTGRPRPYMKKKTEDRFYGPMVFRPRSERPGQARHMAFQSFPSGHASTSAAAAAMLLVTAPALGVPMALSAVCVNGSSLYVNVHYPTDVLFGSGVGLMFGTVGGLVYRRMRLKDPAL